MGWDRRPGELDYGKSPERLSQCPRAQVRHSERESPAVQKICRNRRKEPAAGEAASCQRIGREPPRASPVFPKGTEEGKSQHYPSLHQVPQEPRPRAAPSAPASSTPQQEHRVSETSTSSVSQKRSRCSLRLHLKGPPPAKVTETGVRVPNEVITVSMTESKITHNQEPGNIPTTRKATV